MTNITIKALILSSALLISTEKAVVFDLHKLAKHKGLDVYNRDLTLIDEDAHHGIRLSKAEGEGIAWVKGVEFTNGTIEFDVRGENVKQHSFVGIAFHARDNETFDGIYLRPFHFLEKNDMLRKRAIQFISLPTYTWQVLRAKFPDQFEAAIEPAPDPNGWVHLRVTVQEKTVSVYVNGQDKPSLTFENPSGLTTGKVGLYVADTSGGDFSNLSISTQ